MEVTQIEAHKYGEIYRNMEGDYYFVCFHCSEYFQSADKIIDHIEKVHLQQPQPPPLPESVLESETALKIAISSTIDCDDGSQYKYDAFAADEDSAPTTSPPPTVINYLICDYCLEQIADPTTMESHMLSHLKVYPFDCDICKQEFKFKHMLDGHKRVVHGIVEDFAQQLMCNLCCERFVTSKAYQRHVLHRHVKFKCDQCHCQYNQKKNLRLHMRLKHLPENERPSYACTECDQSFESVARLKDHIRYKHTKEMPFFCHICEKRFHMHGHLSSHMASHRDAGKTYQCADCGQVSKYPKCIRATCFRPANKQKNYTQLPKTNVCDDCGKAYYRSDWLDQHRKEGNCLQKLECRFCQSLFKNKRSLRSHLADLHSGREFPCRHCPEVFAKKHQRYAHERKHKTDDGIASADMDG